MKTLVIYYSYTGKTKKLAEEIAQREAAKLIELRDAKKKSVLSAYVLGSFAAMRQKEAKLMDFTCDLASYDKIIIAMPIWAGYPAPPMNNIIKALPQGKTVELVMTSGSGNSGWTAEKIKKLIAAKGCTVTSYRDVKTS